MKNAFSTLLTVLITAVAVGVLTGVISYSYAVSKKDLEIEDLKEQLNKAKEEESTPTTSANTEATESSSNDDNTTTTTNSNQAGVKTFSSQQLGVKFNYLISQGAPVIEEGDTIYVGGKDGQSVQEFSKNLNDNLKAAIRKKFLTDISEKDCQVSDYNMPNTIANIETAAIKFGFQPDNPGDPRINTSPCPADYRETNGIRYFWMDKNNPDKFFFFNIGQYAILAEPDRKEAKTWQDTFEVVK